jgi:hypothetical protein
MRKWLMPTRKKNKKKPRAKAAAGSDTLIRKQIAQFLEESHAHAGFDAAVDDFPPELRGRKPAGAPHTAWQILEHLRLAQWDILAFSRDGRHKSPKWPEGYWPESETPPSEKAWEESVRRFRADRRAMQKLVLDKTRDLSAIVPHAQSQTLVREALLLMDHNAYHVGQLVLLRRLLGAWKQ